MASNSLFSTVTPCQQNFFWGEYCFAGLCCVWSWVRGSGHGEDSGSCVEVWIEERGGLGKEGKDVGSDGRIWVQMSEGDRLRSLRTSPSRSKLFVVDEGPGYHHGFLWCANTTPKKKENKETSPYLEIPIFTLCDVYKYFCNREMTCLCNVPLDLQSDAIAEPKTKAWVIFLTNVNRRCT